ETAGKRDGIVDDHYLLVMRSARGVSVVVFEMHAPARLPSKAETRRKLAVGPEHHRIVPVEDAHLELAPAVDQIIQKRTQRVRHSGLDRFAVQTGPGIEVPTQYRDRAGGVFGGLCERSEVVRGVDQQCDARHAHYLVAVAPWFENAGRRSGPATAV